MMFVQLVNTRKVRLLDALLADLDALQRQVEQPCAYHVKLVDLRTRVMHACVWNVLVDIARQLLVVPPSVNPALAVQRVVVIVVCTMMQHNWHGRRL